MIWGKFPPELTVSESARVEGGWRRQTARGDVTQRTENAGKKKDARGLDNSGNIEGNPNGIFASPRRRGLQHGGARWRTVWTGTAAGGPGRKS